MVCEIKLCQCYWVFFLEKKLCNIVLGQNIDMIVLLSKIKKNNVSMCCWVIFGPNIIVMVLLCCWVIFAEKYCCDGVVLLWHGWVIFGTKNVLVLWGIENTLI